MHQDLEKLLNQQIGIEFNSSLLYLGMATWADTHNHPGAAAFLYRQSQEEREHMLKIVHYLTQMGKQPRIPTTTSSAQPDYASLQGVFEAALVAEQQVTQSIHHLVDTALSQKDYPTFTFLQWFVQEQLEEENTAKKILDLFAAIGTQQGLPLYTIDQAIEKLRAKSPSSAP